jgi:hypothetical protein
MDAGRRVLAAGVAVAATRAYDRAFDWGYLAEPVIPPPAGAGLVPIIWDGLSLNSGELDSGLCLVVENVDGWLDGPPVEGNDVARVISDGTAWGPKVVRERTIVISGAAAGPAELLTRVRHELAARAVAREPAELVIGELGSDRVLTADVRAGTERLRVSPLGRGGFKWQVTLTAADPALYDAQWQGAQLVNVTEDTGRVYNRDYSWRYRGSYVGNSAVLVNSGNVPAPVYALYVGELTESVLADNHGGIIRLAALGEGMQILVYTATLAAEAPGALSRASYILPGSRPMTIPAGSSSRWYLRAVGSGSIALAWRSAWA